MSPVQYCHVYVILTENKCYYYNEQRRIPSDFITVLMMLSLPSVKASTTSNDENPRMSSGGFKVSVGGDKVVNEGPNQNF